MRNSVENMEVAVRRARSAVQRLERAAGITPSVTQQQSNLRAHELREAEADLRVAARFVSMELRGDRVV
jgi:hypothetical protein